MASKSTNNKKKSAKKKGNSKSSLNKQNSFMKDELIVWLTLAICILILLSNFGLAGFVGDGISEVLMKLFGWIAYVIPFILFGIVSFLISNRGNGIAIIKAVSAGILTLLCCTLLQLLNDCGGSLGKVFVKVLTPAIGVAGTYAVILIGIIVCLVVITEKSAINGVKKQSGKAYNKAKEDALRRREIAEEKRRDRELIQPERKVSNKPRRSDRLVEGVSFNTTITDTKEKEPVISSVLETAPVDISVNDVPQFKINRAKETVLQEDTPIETPVTEDEKPVRSKPAKMSAKEAQKEIDNVNTQVKNAEEKESQRAPLR